MLSGARSGGPSTGADRGRGVAVSAQSSERSMRRSDIELPSFKAAAVQASPVYLDPKATTQKACSLIREAARNGAQLVAFPEAFVPGYPYWNWMTDPVTGSAWFERLARASVLVPGPEIALLSQAARRAGTWVVIGVNERVPHSLGALYNTLVFIGADGAYLGKHRKLVPPWAALPAGRIPIRWLDSRCSRKGSWCTSRPTSRCRWRPRTTIWRKQSNFARWRIRSKGRSILSSP